MLDAPQTLHQALDLVRHAIEPTHRLADFILFSNRKTRFQVSALEIGNHMVRKLRSASKRTMQKKQRKTHSQQHRRNQKPERDHEESRTTSRGASRPASRSW